MYSGLYTGDTTPEDQQLFVVERRAFTDLCTSLAHPCTCHSTAMWRLQSTIQVSLIKYKKLSCVHCVTYIP